ncbi:MAG: 2-hydroxychromene-2-carboxylate isomerase [Hyphomonadaceae bacterium]
MKIEFFFDCSSPWTYLAFERIQPLAAEFGAEIAWRPILVGGIFNQVNPGVEFFKAAERMPQRKIDYILKDMADWARDTGVAIHFPPKGHPVNSVKAMRACLVLAPQGKLIAFARACFQAYFGAERDLADDAVIAACARQAGADPDALAAAIQQQSVKDALRANVDEAIARGAFGSPTYYLDGGDMYFGVDRLQMLRAAMARKRAAA